MKIGKGRGLCAAFVLIIFFAACTPGPVDTSIHADNKPESRKTEKMTDRFDITTGSLPNGLRYVIDRTDVSSAVSVVAIVKAGSIYEFANLGGGMSHFCEHLVHEGTTTTKKGEEYTALVEKLGNNSNAYTTSDHTAYYITTTADQWGTALECIGDWLFDCQFTKDEYERERGVIIEEIRKALSEPGRIVSQRHSEMMFTEHPVRYPVLGYLDIYEKTSRDDLYAYYKKMYIPQNIVISISGPVKTEEAEKTISKILGDVKSGPAVLYPEMKEPRQLGKRESRIVSARMRGGYVRMGYHSITLDHPDLFALDVLSDVLSGGETARMPYSIREKKALAQSIGTYSWTPMYDAGIFGVYSQSDPKNIPEIKREIHRIIDEVKEKGVTQEEIEKVIKQTESETIRSLKTAERRAMNFGKSFFWTANPLFDIYYLEHLKKVTPEQVRDVCRKYLVEDNLTVTIMVPEGTPVSSQKDKTAVTEEDTKKGSLPNGITVLTRKCGSLPIINIEIVMLGGTIIESSKQAGISRLFAQMLLRGSKKYSRDDVLSFFDAIGGDISAESGRNTVRVSAEVLTEDLEKTLEILADIITAPLFPEQELAKIKQLSLQRIKSQDDHWGRELSNRFRENFYKVHPYGNNPLGTEESLKNITHKDINDLFTKLAVGKNMVVGVFGDIPADISDQISQKFSSVPNKAYAAVKADQEPKLNKSKRLVFQSKSPQVAGVFVGYQGISYKDIKKSSTLEVIDAMTSGKGFPGGWLHPTLRGAQLVYVVHAFNVSGLDPGYFGIYAGCNPQNVEKVEKLIFREMGRLEKGEFSDKELKEAKHLCIMNELLNNQTPGQFAMRETIDTVYGLGHDFYKGYEKRINKVTKEDIIETAKELFEHHVIVINLPKSHMPDKNEKR